MDLPPSKTHRFSGQDIYQRLSYNIQKVVKGQPIAIHKLLAAFVSAISVEEIFTVKQ